MRGTKPLSDQRSNQGPVNLLLVAGFQGSVVLTYS